MSELLFAGCEDNVEFAGGLRDILKRDDIKGDRNILSFAGRFVDLIERLLGTIDLPPKDVVIAGVGSMLDRAFVVFDVPGPDAVIEPLIKAAVLSAVGQLYDRLASE